MLTCTGLHKTVSVSISSWIGERLMTSHPSLGKVLAFNVYWGIGDIFFMSEVSVKLLIFQ